LAGIVISIYGENRDLNNNPLQREFSSSNQKNCIFLYFQARLPCSPAVARVKLAAE
jgi:hypothetical protein